ncbi:MAG: hypothetical protein R6U58_11695 [Bacteroidales bacterium]
MESVTSEVNAKIDNAGERIQVPFREDHALAQLIDENDPGDNLLLNEARSYYNKIRYG